MNAENIVHFLNDKITHYNLRRMTMIDGIIVLTIVVAAAAFVISTKLDEIRVINKQIAENTGQVSSSIESLDGNLVEVIDLLQKHSGS